MGQSEVKGLWFVVAKRYLIDRYEPDLPAKMAALVDAPLRSAFLDPLRSHWYPEACLTQFMAAFDELVTHGDQRKMIAAFEDCTLQGVHRFFQAMLRMTSPDFLLRRTPVLWGCVRRNQGRLTVESDETRAIVHYADFPYFDDVNYRLLALGTLRPLATLCGGTSPRASIVDYGKNWLDVEVTYR
jgi:hypothetical protein